MLALGLIAVSLATQPVTHKLCGRTYVVRAELLQQLKHNPSVVQVPPHNNTYYWLDQDRLTFWWIHYDAAGPDYITCIEKRDTGRRGYLSGPVERDCGNKQAACKAQAHNMVGIKF